MKCTLCNERNGNTRCEGCNTLFCLPCMNKHHDELIQQFQSLTDIRNEVRQSLSIDESVQYNEQQISCLDKINEWERDMIEGVQRITIQARMKVHQLMYKYMSEISLRFDEVSLDMQQQEKEGSYLENDIERVKHQLDQLKNDVNQVNEKLQTHCVISSNIDWNQLITILEEVPSNTIILELNGTESKSTKEKQKSTMRMTDKPLEASSIPVHASRNLSLRDPRTIDFNHRIEPPRRCITCQRNFRESSSMRRCPECERSPSIRLPAWDRLFGDDDD